MIARQGKKKTKKAKGQGYQRTKLQRTSKEYANMSDNDRGFALSAIDAPHIEYNDTGTKI